MVGFLIPMWNDFSSHNQEPLLPCQLNNNDNINNNNENVGSQLLTLGSQNMALVLNH